MNSHLFGTWSPTVRHCLTYGLTWHTPVTNGKGVHPQSGHWEGEQFLVFKISPSTATNLSGINAGMDSTPFERDLQSMFLGLWPTRCRSDFVIHSTNNSKKPVAHFSLFFFALLLAPPLPTLPSMLRNPVTSPLQACMFVYIQALVSLLWCRCSLILPQCMHWMLDRKHRANSHSRFPQKWLYWSCMNFWS